jgi:hypothetical protein
MRCIEIAEALGSGDRGSAIDLNDTHNVPILKSGCAHAVSYAFNSAVNGCSCFEPTEKRSAMKGLKSGEEVCGKGFLSR